VAVEKLTHQKMAEQAFHQEATNDVLGLGRHFLSPRFRLFATKGEFFNSHAC
jgi:hypothetical protein